MKRCKGLMALTTLAVAAAIFAAPAMAQETIHFQSNGNPIGAGGVTVHYTGAFGWENENGGMACEEVTALVTFTTFDADVTEFKATKGCKTTGLLPAVGCHLTSTTAPLATNLPWTIDPLTVEVGEVTGVDIDLPMQAGCLFGSNLEMTGEVQVTGAGGDFSTVTLSGNLTTPAGEVEVEGDLTATSGSPDITTFETE